MTRWALYEAPPEGPTCDGCGHGSTIYGIAREGKRSLRLVDEHVCYRLSLIRHRSHEDGQPFPKAPECVEAVRRGADVVAIATRCMGAGYEP
jgi:hypothetical protein